MAPPFKPKVATANALIDGTVVYLGDGETWTGDHRRARVAVTADEATALLDIAARHQDRVVGPYLAEVALDGAGIPWPTHFREILRTRGPSIDFHGKQAE